MEIKFKYSIQYEKTLNQKAYIMAPDFVHDKIKEMEEFWNEGKTKIESELTNITGLTFKEDSLPCYLNSFCSLSDPFSLKVEDSPEMKDNLVHELIHIILTQNNVGETDGWKQLQEDFKEEYPLVRVHVLVHAIHELIAKQLFEDRVEKIKVYSDWPAYVKAWKIVDEMGAQEVVNTYLK